MNITSFNALTATELSNHLESCCGSLKWRTAMIKAMPFGSECDLVKTAEEIWYNKCNSGDWMEAFTHHPEIGDIKSLTEKFANTSHLAGNEQSGVNEASADVIEALAVANQQYKDKFGFIFIVCATGKSAGEMLRLLNDRQEHTLEEELFIAMGEQHKITILRLKKAITNGDWTKLKIGQLTTHVLDTSIGRPGADITIRLKAFDNSKWQTIAIGVTNSDGRIGDLLPSERQVNLGNYKMVFDIGKYYKGIKVKSFYPMVEINFTVFDHTHYHVPLLVNPFGFSTYRGS